MTASEGLPLSVIVAAQQQQIDDLTATVAAQQATIDAIWARLERR